MELISAEEAEKIGSLMFRVGRVLHKFADITEGKNTLTGGQRFVLYLINQEGISTVSEIASHLEIALPTATGIVNRLVSGGYVKRTNDTTDRRIIRIAITQKGQKIMAELTRKKVAQIQKLFSYLTSEERETYINMMENLLERMNNKN